MRYSKDLSVGVQIRLDPATDALLVAAASSAGVSKSALIRCAVARYLTDHPGANRDHGQGVAR